MERLDKYRGAYGRPFLGMDGINLDDCGPEYYDHVGSEPQFVEYPAPNTDLPDRIVHLEDWEEIRSFKRWRLKSMDKRLYDAIQTHVVPTDLAFARPIRAELFRAVAETLEEIAPDLADSMTTTQLSKAIDKVRRFLHSKQWGVR